MIQHVVMFTLKSTDPNERMTNTDQIRARLAALVGEIPGLSSVILEPDLGLVDGHWDLVLVSVHADNAALEAYQVHPLHKEVASFIGALVSDRATVDYAPRAH
jgi:hypothetical protein